MNPSTVICECVNSVVKMYRGDDPNTVKMDELTVFRKCSKCNVLSAFCDICGYAFDMKPKDEQMRLRSLHLLTHYFPPSADQRSANIVANIKRGNFLPENVKLTTCKWHVSTFGISKRFPHIPFISIRICMKSLDQVITDFLNGEGLEIVLENNNEFFSIDVYDILYVPLMKYLRTCECSCSSCDMEYDCFPTVQMVLSHLVRGHGASMNVASQHCKMPPLSDFISIMLV